MMAVTTTAVTEAAVEVGSGAQLENAVGGGGSSWSDKIGLSEASRSVGKGGG